MALPVGEGVSTDPSSQSSTYYRCGSTISPAQLRRRPRHANFTPSRLRHRHPAQPGAQWWWLLRRALLAAVAIGVLLGVVSVQGQDIVLMPSSSGCIADRSPGPPVNLKAIPKDSRVLLSWDPPRDGACVTQYVVNVADATYRASKTSQSTSTSGRTAVIEGLTNDRLYVFAVQAYNSKFMSGGTAQVTATPTDLCGLRETPGKPTNLRVQAGKNWARLCWDGVENDACVDQYRLSATPVDGPGFRSSGGDKISKGGCANITGLANDVRYRFTVLPVSNRLGSGIPASVTAEVGVSTASRNGWTCKPIDGCAPNRPGLCTAGGGCTAVARRGDCRVPAMYDVDWVNKQVTQWCGSTCPCELGPAQGGALMGSPRGLGGVASGSAGVLSATGTTAAGSGMVASSAPGAGPSRERTGAFAGLAGTPGLGGDNHGSGNGMNILQRTPGGGLGAGMGMMSIVAGTGVGNGAILSDLSNTRTGQFINNMAGDMVGSGVVGEAVGKVAQQVVSNQVNTVLQAMWGQAEAALGRPVGK